MLRVIDQGVLSHRRDRGAYMPSITELDGGELIACQHVGSALAAADNFIEVLRSSDSGRTWRNQGSIHGGLPNDGWAYRGPDIHAAPGGRLLLSATRFLNSGHSLFDPDSEALQRPEMLLFESLDRGFSWSAPWKVPVDLPPDRYTCNKAGSLMLCGPGRWLFPFETWKPDGYCGPPDQKAAAICSTDEGATWNDVVVIADDPTGRMLFWDQLNTRLPDGRIYVTMWTHLYGTKDDLPIHWVTSHDAGRTWSRPWATNLEGQVACPIALGDGRVAVIYNHRRNPAGVRAALSEDLTTFDRDHELVLFDAGREAQLGVPEGENFLAEHMLIGFGKPNGTCLADGSLMTCFWCTSGGVTHTRWTRLSAER